MNALAPGSPRTRRSRTMTSKRRSHIRVSETTSWVSGEFASTDKMMSLISYKSTVNQNERLSCSAVSDWGTGLEASSHPVRNGVWFMTHPQHHFRGRLGNRPRSKQCPQVASSPSAVPADRMFDVGCGPGIFRLASGWSSRPFPIQPSLSGNGYLCGRAVGLTKPFCFDKAAIARLSMRQSSTRSNHQQMRIVT